MIATEGGITLLLDILSTYPTHALIQEQVTAALANLAVGTIIYMYLFLYRYYIQPTFITHINIHVLLYVGVYFDYY